MADFANNRVSQYTLKGALVRHLATAASGVKGPMDVAECEDGFLIANYGDDSVLKVDSKGLTRLGG